jgi:parallel beta-helix repeat protein
MKRIKVFIAVFFVLLIASSFFDVKIACANPSIELPTIVINADGSVKPDTVPITRNGNIYSLTGNISNYQIIIDCGNIILDGAGFTIIDNNNVFDTSMDMRLDGNNVTVRNLNLISCYQGICVSGSDCKIVSNSLDCGHLCLWMSCSNNQVTNNVFNNDIGIFLEGEANVISGNRFYNNWCIEISDGKNNVISDNFFNYVQSDIQVYRNDTINVFRSNFSTRINSRP